MATELPPYCSLVTRLTELSQLAKIQDFTVNCEVEQCRGNGGIFIYDSGYVFCVDLRTNSDYFPIQP